MTRFLTALGDFGAFACRVAGGFLPGRMRASSTLRQMHRLGVESLTVVNLCAFAIGVVMVLQSAALLSRYGAKAQVATLMSAAFVREIGPV
ncbi:MAG TPA: ABC transporter permease, partial [Planctomycetota bacterium]|nr:ABC transporter permease [Planctomycetota bacterium]